MHALALMLAGLALVHPTPRAKPGQTAAQLDVLLETLRGTEPYTKRIDALSAAFLGTPYRRDPLGEGKGQKPDPSPTFRLDVVDCLTYVSTVLALARSSSVAEAKGTLQEIRYDGVSRTYVDRNDFMESEWIPNAIKKGFLKNITARIGGTDVVHHVRTITLADWKTRHDARQLVLPDDRAPVGRFDLAVLPLDEVDAHAASIPDGTILLVAHHSSRHIVDRISHLGFVIRRDGRLYVRHASSVSGRVIEDSLDRFIAKDRLYKLWPVSGYVFLQPLPARALSAEVDALTQSPYFREPRPAGGSEAR